MEQESLQVQNSLEEAIKVLREISNPQEKGLILTDILINDIYFIRSLILCGQEEKLKYYLEDLKIIVDKAKEIKNNLTVSNVSKEGILIKILQQQPVRMIFEKINSVLKNIKKQFPRQINEQDIYNLHYQKTKQLFDTSYQLQSKPSQNERVTKSQHQLTVLFQMCKNQQEQKSLLNSFVGFILPTCNVQIIDYISIFKMLGVENNYQQQISEQSLQLLNKFFQNCWLNRKYLLRFFKQGFMMNCQKYTPLNDLKLKILNGDFDGQIENSQNIQLEINKLQIIGDKKVSEMKYQPRVNEICNFKLFTVEPYCIDQILLTPQSEPLNCLLGEGQEINLQYGEEIKEYILFHQNNALKVIIKMVKSQENIRNQNEILNKQKNQGKMQTFETETDNYLSDSTEQTEDLEEIKEDEQSLNKLFNKQNKLNGEPQFYHFNQNYKLDIEFQKGLKNQRNFQVDQKKDCLMNNNYQFQYELTENITIQFNYDKITQHLKIKQLFKQNISNFAQSTFLEVPINSTILIQKDTVLFSQFYTKYILLFS
ncbi:hypothetical protein ABPG74_003847 [Tetrahymena malaccensis]